MKEGDPVTDKSGSAGKADTDKTKSENDNSASSSGKS